MHDFSVRIEVEEMLSKFNIDMNEGQIDSVIDAIQGNDAFLQMISKFVTLGIHEVAQNNQIEVSDSFKVNKYLNEIEEVAKKVVVSEEVAILLKQQEQDDWSKQYNLISHCKGYSGNGILAKKIYIDEFKALSYLQPLEYAKCLLQGYTVEKKVEEKAGSTTMLEYIIEDKQFEELSSHTTLEGIFDMISENRLDGIEDKDEELATREMFAKFTDVEKKEMAEDYGFIFHKPTEDLIEEYKSLYPFLKLEVITTEDKYCNRCKSKVRKSENKEYAYECLNCDEDLYLFEVHEKVETE